MCWCLGLICVVWVFDCAVYGCADVAGLRLRFGVL